MLLELFPTLIAALAIDFFLYITGVVVLKSLSFGYFQCQILAFNDYKEVKKTNKLAWYMPYFTGILFYVGLVSIIAWLV